MSLQIGQHLGSFEITSLIGKGGMGEVYRAKDTKLKRDVAIKILPDEFSRDTDRVSRFQREAEALAALNHQNIAAIYDLQQSDATRYLILEFVEGDTLSDILKRRGALPVDEALQIAKQICEALEAAHEKGIIHRDLKPANVKITPDGKVKVLDFGLAKAFEAETSKGNLSQSPTLSMAATNAGVILGTAAYMSPEQARGRPLDRRTDIFAFGAVLYEMLTRHPAFDGEDVQDILGSVLKSEPDWTRLPSDVPPSIQKLLRLCLQKDVKKRRHDAADVRIDIEEALVEPVAANPAAKPVRSARLAWVVAAAAILLAVVLVIPSVRYLRETLPPAPPETRVDIVTPLTTRPFDFAISPDGRRLVFVASVDGPQRLWLRQLDAAAAQPLPGTEGATSPFWSPDSRSIAFFAGTGGSGLKRLDIGGGPVQTLVGVAAGGGGTWNTEGVILYMGNGGALNRVSSSGGEVVALPKSDPALSVAFPQFLPGGGKFLVWSAGTAETAGIYLGSLDSPELKRLTLSDTAGQYAPPGWLFYMRQGTLLARRFDTERGELTSEPLTVVDQVGSGTLGGGTPFGAFSVSQTGAVAFRSGTSVRRQLTWFDRSGKAVGTLGEPDDNDLLNPAISPDGRRVAVDRVVQGNRDIWIIDGSRVTRFTFDPSTEDDPVWSPDGNWIAFRSRRNSVTDIFRKTASGAGADELVVESLENKTLTDWSRDGRSLLLLSNSLKTASDLLVMSLDGDRKPKVFLNTNFNEAGAHFSPDGHWVAYQSNISGRAEVYVRPFPEGPGQWQISTAGGNNARWSPDGKELYYMDPDGKLMAVQMTVKNGTLEPGTPVSLFQSQRVLGVSTPNRAQYAVAPDGRFLFNVTVGDAPTSPITLVLNWKPPTK